jgi:hypothetical protein
MPWAALLQIRNIVAFECPSRMWKLLGPEKGYHGGVKLIKQIAYENTLQRQQHSVKIIWYAFCPNPNIPKAKSNEQHVEMNNKIQIVELFEIRHLS